MTLMNNATNQERSGAVVLSDTHGASQEAPSEWIMWRGVLHQLRGRDGLCHHCGEPMGGPDDEPHGCIGKVSPEW